VSLPRRPTATGPLRRPHARAVVLIVVTALAAVVSACSTSSPSGGNTGYITGDGVVTTIAPGDRKSAPELRGDALGGGRVDLADHRGSIVVVNVWAAWCPDCRADAPVIAKLAGEFEPKGLAVIGPTKLYGFAAGGDARMLRQSCRANSPPGGWR